MAEGMLRALAPDRFEVASAGTEQTRVPPLAERALREISVDIGGHESKTLDRFLDEPWDHVITVCDSANESCPVFPRAARRLHGASRTRPAPPERTTSSSRCSGASATRSPPGSARGSPRRRSSAVSHFRGAVQSEDSR